MIAITGIAYGISRMIVRNHAVGAAEIIWSCCDDEVEPGEHQDDENAQNAFW